MRRALVLGLVVMGAACAITPPTRSDLGWDYPFQRPVVGRDGGVLPITEADWHACDDEADAEARLESAYRRAGPGGLLRNEVVDVFSLGFARDPQTVRALSEPEAPEMTRARHQTYERLMRSCLVNRGYAIRVPPAPNRSFGATP